MSTNIENKLDWKERFLRVVNILFAVLLLIQLLPNHNSVDPKTVYLIGFTVLLEVVDKINNEKFEKGQFEFENPDTGETDIVNFKVIPGRSWAVVISADKNELYAASRSNLATLATIGILSFILIVALAGVAVTISTKPLANITNTIRNLGNLDLSKDASINPYVGTTSEVGLIATAVDSKFSDTVLSIEDREKSLNDMIKLALESIIK